MRQPEGQQAEDDDSGILGTVAGMAGDAFSALLDVTEPGREPIGEALAPA